MKERPIIMTGESVRAILEGRKTQTRRVIKPQPRNGKDWRCPYGQSGGRLWVRETWQAQSITGEWWHKVKKDERPLHNWSVVDRATLPASLNEMPPKWISPLFMPRWASRITLEVTGVRVERVQDISEDDAIAEGTGSTSVYRLLWDSINAKRGYSWDSNPWVWAVGFKIIKEAKQ